VLEALRTAAGRDVMINDAVRIGSPTLGDYPLQPVSNGFLFLLMNHLKHVGDALLTVW